MRAGAARDMGAFLALAVAFRAMFWLAVPRVLDTADAIHYIGVAKQFAAGNLLGVDPKIPPLYPALMAAAHLVAPDWEIAGGLVSLVASSLLVIPVYVLSRELHGRRAARIAVLMVAIWPWLADYASRVGTDALGCTLWFMTLWTFARAMRRGGWWLVAAPLSLFALHLTRPEGTGLLAAAVVGAFVLCAGADNRKLLHLIPFAVACAVLLGAYAAYMRTVTGAATMNYRAHLIVSEFDVRLLAPTAMKTLFEVLPIMLGPILLVFMGVGLFHRGALASPDGQRDVRFEFCIFAFAAVQWGLSLFVLSPEPRYLMSVVVALSLWSARGIAVVGQEAAALNHGRWLRPLPVAAMVVPMLLGTAITVTSEHLDRRPREPREYKAAGLWMKNHLEPGLIFTRKPQVGYYADMPSTGPALDDSLEGAIARARNAGARYVVVDERYTAQMAPGVASLLDPAQAPPGLRLLKDLSPYPRCRVVIYELAPAPTANPKPEIRN